MYSYSDFVSVNNSFLLTYSARDNRLDEYYYLTYHFIELNEDISHITYCRHSQKRRNHNTSYVKTMIESHIMVSNDAEQYQSNDGCMEASSSMIHRWICIQIMLSYFMVWGGGLREEDPTQTQSTPLGNTNHVLGRSKTVQTLKHSKTIIHVIIT